MIKPYNGTQKIDFHVGYSKKTIGHNNFKFTCADCAGPVYCNDISTATKFLCEKCIFIRLKKERA